jgi:hypothetical protein
MVEIIQAKYMHFVLYTTFYWLGVKLLGNDSSRYESLAKDTYQTPEGRIITSILAIFNLIQCFFNQRFAVLVEDFHMGPIDNYSFEKNHDN